MSCVRSNDHQGIGFLNDPRRLNVALTRAKYGLIIIGNPKVLSRQPLWNHLLNDYKEKRCLVEGPLNNLKESMIQFSKPRKLVNKTNPGGRFMTNTMFDAREALIAPGLYANRPVRSVEPVMDSYYRTHDRMAFFPPAPDQARNVFAANIPVPVGMFYPSVPAPAFQYNQTVNPGRQSQHHRGKQAGQRQNQKQQQQQLNYLGNNAASQQDLSQGALSQGPLSQGPLTQGGMSQGMNPLSQPLSQPDLSQDSYLGDDFNLKSHADQALSQDSTYQGDRGGYQPYSQPEFSQQIYNSQY